MEGITIAKADISSVGKWVNDNPKEAGILSIALASSLLVWGIGSLCKTNEKK